MKRKMRDHAPCASCGQTLRQHRRCIDCGRFVWCTAAQRTAVGVRHAHGCFESR